MAFVAVALLLISGGAAAAAGPDRPFQSGLWSGGAYTDDRTGGFSHCSAGVVYDSGTSMFVVSTEAHGWWLGFTNSQWTLTLSGSIPVKLQFDGRPAVEVFATVANAQLLLVPIPEDSQLIDTFRRSSKLTVTAQERSFSLNLGGTSTVMSELTNCVRSAIAIETRSSNASPAPEPGVSGALETAAPAFPPVPPAPVSVSPVEAPQPTRMRGLAEPEEVILAKNFLLAARLPNAQLIETDKPPALANFRAVWKSENAAGAVKIIPPGREVTGLAIASELIAVDPQLCKGNFAATRSREVIEDGVVFRASLSCADAQNERTAQYYITARRKGGFVVFAVIGNYSTDRGAATDKQTMDLFNMAAVQAVGPED
jgi:hypothetical protein